VVADSLGAGVADVHLTVVGVPVLAKSGPDGGFRFASVPAGPQRLVARRIGYQPESLTISVAAGVVTRVTVELALMVQRVEPVLVNAPRVKHTGRLRAFHDRRQRGIGHFFTANDIARQGARNVTDLFRTIPGVAVQRRGAESVITFRGMRCTPLVWIDGSPATAGFLDPDIVEPSSLSGIEVYLGPSTVPQELMGTRGRGSCGVIALWTNVPEPRATPQPRKVSAEDLSLMVASLTLYTADQVDRAAIVHGDSRLEPAYPATLLEDSIPGRVVAEFVVETNGRPDMDTFAAVVSNDRRFTEAVRQAISKARFVPAMLQGKRVRQLVQMPFVFRVSGTP
jgi:TonB family protein